MTHLRPAAFLILAAVLTLCVATPAWSAVVRIKVTTLFSADPNDVFAEPVSLIGFTVGDVGGVTGDDEELTKCIGGTDNRLRCFANDDCRGDGTCANPGDNDGVDGDDGFGRARIASESGPHTVDIPVTELVDFDGNRYRVGSVNISPTTTGEVTKCRPNDTEGEVGYEFDAITNPASQSEYEVAIRIVPLNAPELTDGELCLAAENDKPMIRCRRVINGAGANYFAAAVKALNACQQAKLAGKLDPLTDCKFHDPKTVAVFEKLNLKIQIAIEKACGGKDKICGTPDDISVRAIGFPATCDTGAFPYAAPNQDCFDVSRCVSGTQALMAESVLSFYAQAGYADPKSEKGLNKCQRAASDGAADYLAAVAKANAKCWDGFLAKKHTNSCPSVATDVVAAKAGLKLAARTEKACCGRDKICFEDGDDFVPSAIGFPAECPAVFPPGGSFGVSAHCGELGSTDVPNLTHCLRCVADFTAQCVTRSAAASVTTYPPQCKD